MLHIWKKFINSEKLNTSIIREPVFESWLRCKISRIDPYAMSGPKLSPGDLHLLLRDNSKLLQVATPLMEDLYKFIKGSRFVIILADREGYILKTLANPAFIGQLTNWNMIPGSNFSERYIGTNAIGTSLYINGPIQVQGEEHYLKSNHTWTGSAAPIHSSDGELIGCLSISGPADETHIHNLGMIVSTVNSIEKQFLVKDTIKELQELNNGLLDTLALVLDLKDNYTANHSFNVMNYSNLLAEMMNFQDEQIKELRYAALLHDIGKIGIPDNVLNKPSRLSDSEFTLIKQHPVTGAKLLKKARFSPRIIEAVRHHHEYFNGRGYPDRVTYKDIPLFARIITIADSFDAMTTYRVYKPPMTREDAKEEIWLCRRKQFDPELAELFLKCV
ncbi:MAG: HD domain-containing protein [Halanaerobiales bacterium]|nr:HD domain-containing protein [Halanaerobiales bacterium]